MICPQGQILLSRRLPGTGQCLSASPATSLSILCTVNSDVDPITVPAKRKKRRRPRRPRYRRGCGGDMLEAAG